MGIKSFLVLIQQVALHLVGQHFMRSKFSDAQDAIDRNTGGHQPGDDREYDHHDTSRCDGPTFLLGGIHLALLRSRGRYVFGIAKYTETSRNWSEAVECISLKSKKQNWRRKN